MVISVLQIAVGQELYDGKKDQVGVDPGNFKVETRIRSVDLELTAISRDHER